MTNPPWFIVQFKPQAHRLAVRNLDRQGFTTFLPLHDVTRTERGHFVTRARPLFPGYLFLMADDRPEAPRLVSSTLGVNRLVTMADRPAQVPDEVIEALRRRCDMDGRLTEAPVLEKGDQIQLLTGPFADFVGTVERIDADKRVWVLLDLLGRTTRVALDRGRWQAV